MIRLPIALTSEFLTFWEEEGDETVVFLHQRVGKCRQNPLGIERHCLPGDSDHFKQQPSVYN